jgi:hypothetical protein
MLPISAPAADIRDPAGPAFRNDLIDDREKALKAALPELVSVTSGVGLCSLIKR